MNNKRILLLKTLLLSTSRINKMRHSKDKKVKSKAIGGFVGSTRSGSFPGSAGMKKSTGWSAGQMFPPMKL